MMINTKKVPGLICLISIIIFSACGGHRAFVPSPVIPDDRQHIPEPEEYEYSEVADAFDMLISNQLEQSLDLSRQFRHLTNDRKQAYNVNAFDEVPNSSWFTNRNAARQMSIAELRRGPDTGDGPDTTGKWTVTRAKVEGVTPGFHIKDKRGDRYLIKFDPKGYPELATGAEVVSTKLFYAMGYFTPENYISYFYPESLMVGDKVKFTDANGKKRFMSEQDLKDLISRIEVGVDGRVRVVASKYIIGVAKGPFTYEGVRKDDPNDFIPHQHRRELRALYVTTSWLNHTDTKAGNSFDSYITEDGKSYIRHYLIDFGTTFGSAARGPSAGKIGHENSIDPHMLLTRTFALGLYYPDYDKYDDVKYNSIGLFGSELFDPGHYKPLIPNPAFENKTNRDCYWGARLVMSFTDHQLEEIVKEGQYSDPAAEAYLLKVLKERRDKIGRYWYARVNPLDYFRLMRIRGSWHLCFEDMMVLGNLEESKDTKYRVVFEPHGDKVESETDKRRIDLKDQHAVFLSHADDASFFDKFPVGEVTIYTFRNSTGNWSKWLKVYIQYDKESAKIMGIERQE